MPADTTWLCHFCLKEWKHFFETGEMVFRPPRGGKKKWVP
jgi:hypothetical protein